VTPGTPARRQVQQTSRDRTLTNTPTNVLTFLYDGAGNLTAAQNYGSAYTLSYDADNRVTVVQEPQGQALTFSYDGVGNRTLVQDSLGGLTTSVFNKDNQLTSRQFTGNGQALRIDLGYQTDGMLSTLTRYNAVAGLTTEMVGSTTYLYDTAQRMTGINDYNYPSGVQTTIATYAYSYDAGDRLTSEVDEAKLVTYAYDPANQLTFASGSAFSYDANGNRNSTGYATSSDNELTNDGTWTYTYDQRGNVAGKSNAAGQIWTYTYDNNNELTTATESSSGSVVVRATYSYDAFGNRIESNETQGGVTTATYDAFDGWNPAKGQSVGNANFDVWAEFTGGGSLTTRYVRGDAVDQVFAQMANSGSPSWLLTDHLGSVVGETSSSGVLQLTMVYDAFGNMTSTVVSGSPMAVEYQWEGLDKDAATGLYYDDARFYNSAIGRPMSPDPLGFAAGDSNLYRYVNNEPTNGTDPSGDKLFAWSGAGKDQVLQEFAAAGVTAGATRLGWVQPSADLSWKLGSAATNIVNLYYIVPTSGDTAGLAVWYRNAFGVGAPNRTAYIDGQSASTADGPSDSSLSNEQKLQVFYTDYFEAGKTYGGPAGASYYDVFQNTPWKRTGFDGLVIQTQMTKGQNAVNQLLTLFRNLSLTPNDVVSQLGNGTVRDATTKLWALLQKYQAGQNEYPRNSLAWYSRNPQAVGGNNRQINSEVPPYADIYQQVVGEAGWGVDIVLGEWNGQAIGGIASGVLGVIRSFRNIRTMPSAARRTGPPVNQMNQQIRRGQAPPSVSNVNIGRVPGEQPHVHFSDGSALNIDGTWKHLPTSGGTHVITNRERAWLVQNGWTIP